MVRNFLLLVFLTPLLAFAHEMHLDHAPINPSDNASLQRGAKYFVNYCLNCHSANYMRYNRLTDIGLNDKQILENFVFSESKVGDLMKVNMNPNASKVWFGVAPPDLSVITRARSSEAGSGADWVYTYLRSFYRDPTRPTGWNNTTYPNVAMPHVLWELQGEQELKAHPVRMEGYEATEEKPALVKPGQLSPVEYDQVIVDLVNYLSYMAEPTAKSRKNTGIVVLTFLFLMVGLTYALKKEFWKDVH